MRIVWLIGLGALIMVVAGCAPITVKHDHDRNYNFSQLHTFKMGPKRARSGPGPEGRFGPMENRIHKAVENELEMKGYKKQPGKPDFAVVVHIVVNDVTHIETVDYQTWKEREKVRHYKQGWIVVDIVDPRAKQLIWRGVAQGLKAGPDLPEKTIVETVHKILSRFPPPEVRTSR